MGYGMQNEASKKLEYVAREEAQRAAGTKRPTRRCVDERGSIGLKGKTARGLLRLLLG